MKTFTLVVASFVAWATCCIAGEITDGPSGGALIRADWQPPQALPPPFRNHCAYQRWTGRPYCSNHCGIDYQFYFCSPASFGCCHVGYGYCDWNGQLRCAP